MSRNHESAEEYASPAAGGGAGEHALYNDEIYKTREFESKLDRSSFTLIDKEMLRDVWHNRGDYHSLSFRSSSHPSIKTKTKIKIVESEIIYDVLSTNHGQNINALNLSNCDMRQFGISILMTSILMTSIKGSGITSITFGNMNNILAQTIIKNISDTNITELQFSINENNDNCVNDFVFRNCVNDFIFRKLIKELARSQVSKLCIDGRMSDMKALFMADNLHNNIKHLEISAPSTKGIEAISENLRNNEELTHLYISNSTKLMNNFPIRSVHDAEILADGIIASNLKHLSIRFDIVSATNNSAIAFFDRLSEMPLESLDISGSPIGGAGYSKLTEILPHTQINHLNLYDTINGIQWNELTDEVKLFARSLNSTKVKEFAPELINLSTIMQELEGNHTITNLIVREDVFIPDEIRTRITYIMQRNQRIAEEQEMFKDLYRKWLNGEDLDIPEIGTDELGEYVKSDEGQIFPFLVSDIWHKQYKDIFEASTAEIEAELGRERDNRFIRKLLEYKGVIISSTKTQEDTLMSRLEVDENNEKLVDAIEELTIMKKSVSRIFRFMPGFDKSHQQELQVKKEIIIENLVKSWEENNLEFLTTLSQESRETLIELLHSAELAEEAGPATGGGAVARAGGGEDGGESGVRAEQDITEHHEQAATQEPEADIAEQWELFQATQLAQATAHEDSGEGEHEAADDANHGAEAQDHAGLVGVGSGDTFAEDIG